MIKIAIFDIDGIMTDGRLTIDESGKQYKSIRLRDLDALTEIKKLGIKVAAITGENTKIVDCFHESYNWDYFYKGCKNKISAMNEIAGNENADFKDILYVGDGKYDVEPIQSSGVGICPCDAYFKAREVADIILNSKSGEGIVEEVFAILEKLNKSFDNDNKENVDADSGINNYVTENINDHITAIKALSDDKELIMKISQVCKVISEVINGGGTLYICGNGGSAADAQHIVAELIGRFKMERKSIPAEALTTNTSILTAIGNDYDYSEVFERQVVAKVTDRDVVLGISTSGTSSNVVKALKKSSEIGASTVMLTGSNIIDDKISDYIIDMPGKEVSRIQEMHILFGHILAGFIEKEYINSNP